MSQTDEAGDVVRRFQEKVGALSHRPSADVPAIVEIFLQESFTAGASDAHLTPAANGLEVRWRLDGVLHPVGVLPLAMSAPVTARLKVLSGLLTYKQDVPQEGRIPADPATGRSEVRISTFPTLHGERTALRFMAKTERREKLADLGLPSAIEKAVRECLVSTSGMVIVTGPAGSGKTTTLYACLREIVEGGEGTRGVVSLEDPIESALASVAQTSLDPRAGLGLAELVKAVLRQDPDVISIGEIRDKRTAQAAFQATLTGHLVLTTTHAGDSIEVLTRLMDMRIPPYVLRSGLRAILAQRLLRKLCFKCRVRSDHQSPTNIVTGSLLNDTYEPAAGGCPACRHTGYSGRVIAAEWLELGENALGRSISEKRDACSLRRLVARAGVKSLREQANELVSQGLTSPSEVLRVFGF